jgi:hypothetical protein
MFNQKFMSLDFEYNEANEPHMGLMAASWSFDKGPSKSVWLYRDDKAKASFAQAMLNKKDEVIILSYNAVAEASCLIAMGLDPRDFKWIDLYLEYRQAGNHNNDFMHGDYFTKDAFGVRKRTNYPLLTSSELKKLEDMDWDERQKLIQKRKNSCPDNSKLDFTLENALINVLKLPDYEPNTKRDARRIILDKLDEYTPEQKAQILDYANDDTTYLYDLLEKFVANMRSRTKWDDDTIMEAMLWRGRYAANVAKYTMKGIPINLERLNNLEANSQSVLDQAKAAYNQECYPVFIYKYQSGKGWYLGKSTKATNAMVDILRKELNIPWKKSAKSGDYSMSSADGEPLQIYEDLHPWIKGLMRIKKLDSVLKGHKPQDLSKNPLDRDKVFRDSLGSDGRVRPWYGPYGSQTARNTPGAKAFVFAQSAVMRALVDPPKGRVIMEIDYGSQEAFVAPILSGDKVLLKAYISGDPYLAFAIETGAAPIGATKKTHKDVRDLYKSTVLGLQYGMGAKKLAIKLTADTKKQVTEEMAKELIKQHRETYPRYYEWKDEVWERYREKDIPIFLKDGWYLDTHQDMKLSVLNFPVQGTGSSIMRVCIDKLYEHNIELICPIHDSMVVECDEADQDKVAAIVSKCMLEASAKILKAEGMRVGEPEICEHGKLWITEKNVYDMPKFEKFFKETVTKNSDSEHLKAIRDLF